MKDAYIIPKGQPLAPDQPDQAAEIERLKQIANDHRDGRLAALEKLALTDNDLRVAKRLLGWAYGKLAYRSFVDMDDCLNMDEIKLMLMEKHYE